MRSYCVVVVIPNWNLKDELSKCLDSLLLSNFHITKIVVVDNGSTDGSPEWVQQNYPTIHLISLEKNRGYAGGLNQGIKYALSTGSDFVLALNNDTIVPSDMIQHLVKSMDENPEIGIISPKPVYYNRPDLIYTLGSKSFKLLPLPIQYGAKWRDKPKYRGLMGFDYITGCAMLIRTELFTSVGLFDSSYYMYYEENDFCRRTRDMGWKIACDGDVIIYHKVELSTNKNNRSFITYIQARNRARFYRQHPHGPHPWLTALAIILVTGWHILEAPFAGRVSLLKPYLLGLWEGWRKPYTPILD